MAKGAQVQPYNYNNSNAMALKLTKFMPGAKKNSRMTLQACARNGDLTQLNELLRLKRFRVKVNKLDPSGLSALHYAARANNVEICEKLLRVEKADAMVHDDEGATPLHYGARKKESKDSGEPDKNGVITDPSAVVKLLLGEYNVDVNAQDKYGSTPLHFCAMRGNQAVATALISDRNIDINRADNLGCTPLHEAATYNHKRLTKLLISYGADVTVTDSDGCSPLHLAAMEGHLDIVQEILKTDLGIKLINTMDNDDVMPLHYAIEGKSVDCVKILVEKGANVNVTCRNSKTGSTPLHLSAIAGEVDDKPQVTTFLLEKGADVTATDLSGATPLHRAAQYDCGKDAKELLHKMMELGMDIDTTDDDNYTSLMTAVAYGSQDITQQLLDWKASTDILDVNDKSIIYIGAENDEFEVLLKLLRYLAKKKKADKESVSSASGELINACDRYGDSALHVAASHGNLKIVVLLIRHEADLDLKNENEETPFLKACINGHLKVIERMLKKDEKLINDEDEDSNTALHLAAEAGHLEVVKMLVEWGAKKEARNGRSRTPLDLSAQGGHIDIVTYFLEEDVSPDPLDKEKVTPLQMASRNGHESVVTLLLDRGADVSCTDVDGKNCLDIAIEADQKSVVRAILKSEHWYIALANDSSDRDKPDGSSENSEPRERIETKCTTPLRRLFRRMPDMAALALSKCVDHGDEKVDLHGRKKCVDFNYDYLDDTYTDYVKVRESEYQSALKKTKNDTMQFKPYNRDLNYVKNNHPLTILVKENREGLLGHSLVLTLIRHKWRLARTFYFIYMAIFLLYLSLVTSFMLIAEAPFNVNSTECEDATEWEITVFEDYCRYPIWVLAGLGLLKDIYQLYLQRFVYLSFANVLDWYSYVSAILLMFTFTNCGARTDWQWQMGAFTILLTWIDVILFLRRLPGLGIYVVMIVEIWHTFMKFFVALFLFVLAFALTFHVLAQNQTEFQTEFYSIAKSFIMMIGEFDYVDMFFDEDEPIMYRETTYAVFLLFSFLVSIIVMNLMIGLAVDDVYGLRERAKVVKLAMQIEFALDVELALPYKIAQQANCYIRRFRFYPEEDRSAMREFAEWLKSIIEGPLLSEKAVKASLVATAQSGRLPELMQLEEKVTGKMKKIKSEVKSNSEKLDLLLEKMDTLMGDGEETTGS